MDRRLILHCGFPKTATTTLQKHLFPHLAGIHYGGKYYDGRLDTLRDNFYSLLRHRSLAGYLEEDPKTRQVVKHITELLNLSAQSSVILSYEEVLVGTLWPRPNSSFSLSHSPGHPLSEQLNFVKDLLFAAGERTPRIIITLRDQRELIPSFYAQAYKNTFSNIRGMRTFSGFLDAYFRNDHNSLLNPYAMDFCHVEDLVTQYFGAENTCLLSYHWLIIDPARFARKLGGFVCSDPDHILSLLRDAPRENARRTGGEIPIMRKGRRDLSAYAGLAKRILSPNSRMGFGAKLLELTQRLQFGSEVFSPTLQELDRISEFYRASNMEFLGRHPSFALGNWAS